MMAGKYPFEELSLDFRSTYGYFISIGFAILLLFTLDVLYVHYRFN